MAIHRTEGGRHRSTFHRLAAALSAAAVCLLTGCGDSLPEDELVDHRAYEAATADDLQAGNFRFPQEADEEEDHFVTAAGLRDNVKELLGGQYWPDAALTEEELEEMTGITENMYVDFLAERQTADAAVDTMIIIHAKEAHVGEVERALEAYREDVIGRSGDDPENLCKAEASRMETIEDYVCFVQLGGDISALAYSDADTVTAYCQEENERALYVLEQEIFQ